jgi:chemotaxis family two-component system response regulator Rcp1
VIQDNLRILCVEDSDFDRRLIKEFLTSDLIKCKTDYVVDGEQALNYLYKKEAYQNALLPDLVLLDLNLPKVDGREVLRKIKMDAGLKHIPVIVLTTSSTDRDVNDCLNMHANCYMVKPYDADQFENLIKKIQEFWLETPQLYRVRH